jgi:hypothetical protein
VSWDGDPERGCGLWMALVLGALLWVFIILTLAAAGVIRWDSPWW